MFDLQVLKSSIYFRKREPLVSGSMNIYPIKLKFSSDWDGLARIAYFTDGFETIKIVLDDSNMCEIPHEVLQVPNREVKFGVRGTMNGEIILPTIWVTLDKLKKGVEDTGEETQEPTPEIIDQILTSIEDLRTKINDVELSIPEPMTAEQLRDLLEQINQEDKDESNKEENEGEENG